MTELEGRHGDAGIDSQASQEQPAYIPAIKFEDFGLVVRFDHALEAKPAELLSLKRFYKKGLTVTDFVIRSESNELYVGLHFVPRRILKEVTEGLKTYQEDEKLTEDQRVLIGHGIYLLERFINPIEED